MVVYIDIRTKQSLILDIVWYEQGKLGMTLIGLLEAAASGSPNDPKGFAASLSSAPNGLMEEKMEKASEPFLSVSKGFPSLSKMCCV